MNKKLSLLLASALLVACQQISTTQGGAIGANRQQTMLSLLSEQQVVQMAGQAYAEETGKARQKGALNTDVAMVTRVRGIANRLIPQTAVYRADALRWKWEVNVENSPELNAYCMAGGKIMVYSSIIQKLQLTDDELAQIMGHEIAHALREHTRERMSEAYSRMLGLSILSAATGGKYDGYLDMANQVATVAHTLPNSREHESEADMMGLELAARAGYNPNAAVTLWQKMAKAGGGQPPQFLSTHPSHGTRINDLQSKIPVVMPLYESAVRHHPVPGKGKTLMATEIERKFLLAHEGWRREVFQSTRIAQGYLSTDPTVRVRVKGDAGFLTIKGKSTDGISRAEFEYPIPPEDALALLKLCPNVLDKTRHLIAAGSLTWEIDEFHGENHGLIVAELELPAVDTPYERPDWLGAEVTGDVRYYNSMLSQTPFSRW